MPDLVRLIALTALLSACRPTTPDPSEIDEDGDGFSAAEDCNDADPAVYPGAEELCNGVDDDCSGQVDDHATDASTWYRDGDLDGYGDPDSSVTACDRPDGYVADATDCNDRNENYHPGAPETDCTDPNDYNCDGSSGFADADGDGFPACEDCDDSAAAVNPAATEACDGVDNDCDGQTDEAGATGEATWYADADGDGYGDPASPLRACDQPEGHVADNTDCNDATADAHPGATEVCDGIDNNCDGDRDLGAVDAPTWYADADKDGYGGTDFTLQACEQPAGYLASGDDCDDLDPKTYPGAAERCDGEDGDCDGVLPDDEADGDGDGVMACAGDCDDTNADVHPGAPEKCNGIDDNCNGTVDGPEAVDPKTWYVDGDKDGYGGTTTSKACDQPAGFVADPGDCDDADADYNPGASPGCDGEDYDCDGAMDNDADGDGFPDAACGGTDCDDTNPSVFPEQGGGLCAMGKSCVDIIDAGFDSGNGMYAIDPDGYATGKDPYEVWCDMTGGGWAYAAKDTPFKLTYTGAVQEMVTPDVDTEYTFWLYGGAAGLGNTKNGGPGGKAWGSKTFGPGTALYVYVGGMGVNAGPADSGDCNTRFGGWNGGGRSTRGGSGGGGATDVRTALGNLDSRILVAGGGGGCGYNACVYAGGAGGGLTGATGDGTSGYLGGGGGTQSSGGVSPNNSTANGAFGIGGSNVQCNDEGGGGGGWYGGAAGGKANVSAGGGSSYLAGMDSDTGTTVGGNAGAGFAEYIFR